MELLKAELNKRLNIFTMEQNQSCGVFTMTSNKLPEVRKDLSDFEKPSQLSVTVLVSVNNIKGIQIGRYIHSLEEWQVDGFHGSFNAIEWWPIPEVGSGYKQT